MPMDPSGPELPPSRFGAGYSVGDDGAAQQSAPEPLEQQSVEPVPEPQWGGPEPEPQWGRAEPEPQWGRVEPEPHWSGPAPAASQYPGYPQPEYDAAQHKSKKALMVTGIAVVAVIAVVIAVVVVKLSGGDDELPPGMLAGSYPDEPDVGWELAVDSVAEYEDSVFTSPKYGVLGYDNGAIVAGDTIVVGVVDIMGGTEDQLIGIDLESGEVKWTMADGSGLACASEGIDGQLPCLRYGGEGSGQSIDFVDLATGEISNSVDVDANLNMIATDGKRVYSGGYDSDDGTLRFFRGGVDDPVADGSAVPVVCELEGAGDASYLGVGSGYVAAYLGPGAELLVRESDGQPVVDYGVVLVNIVDEDTLVVYPCDVGDWDALNARIVNGDGSTRFDVDGHLEYLSLDVASGGRPFVTDDGAVLDPESGDRLWRIPDDYDYVFLVGDVLMVTTEAGIVGYSALTGDELWITPPVESTYEALTDGENIVLKTRNELVAYSLEDGTRSWTVSPDMENGIGRVYESDHGMVVVGADRIVLLPPTGPALPVPSIGG